MKASQEWDALMESPTVLADIPQPDAGAVNAESPISAAPVLADRTEASA
jgi:hypothetical protein